MLEKISEGPAADELRRILGEHEEAVNALRRYVHIEGGDASTSSGPWGVWAGVVVGTAKLLGPQTTLKALREGEVHGRKVYQEALNDDAVPNLVKAEVGNHLLPRQEEHILTLERLIAGAG